jgi:hypothetical protein
VADQHVHSAKLQSAAAHPMGDAATGGVIASGEVIAGRDVLEVFMSDGSFTGTLLWDAAIHAAEHVLQTVGQLGPTPYLYISYTLSIYPSTPYLYTLHPIYIPYTLHPTSSPLPPNPYPIPPSWLHLESTWIATHRKKHASRSQLAKVVTWSRSLCHIICARTGRGRGRIGSMVLPLLSLDAALACWVRFHYHG